MKDLYQPYRIILIFISIIWSYSLFLAPPPPPTYELSSSLSFNQIQLPSSQRLTMTTVWFSHSVEQADVLAYLLYDHRYLYLESVEVSRGSAAYGYIRVNAWEGHPVLMTFIFQVKAAYAGTYIVPIYTRVEGPYGIVTDRSRSLIILQPRTIGYLPVFISGL